MPVELSVDQQALTALSRALAKEADGKKLKRDLAGELRRAIEPLRQEALSRLRRIRSRHDGSLRRAVAQQLKAQGRMSGRAAGARLRAGTVSLRGFRHAARSLNRPTGWRHPVYGDRETWITQTAQPAGWFSTPTRDERHHRAARDAVLTAMNTMAGRIARQGPFRGRR